MTQSNKNINIILQAIDKGEPVLKCSSNNEVNLLCISRRCEAIASCCKDRQCTNCYGPHSLCECLHLNSLTQLLKGLSQRQSKFIHQLSDIAEKITFELKKKINGLQEQVSLSYLTQEEIQTLNSIYIKGFGSLKGDTVKNIYRKLLKINAEAEDLEIDLTISFQQQANKTIQQLEKLQKNLISQYMDKLKIKLAYKTPQFDPKIIDQFEELRKKCISLQLDERRQKERANKLKDEKVQLEENVRNLKEDNEKLKNDLKEQKDKGVTRTQQFSKQKQKIVEQITILRENAMVLKQRNQLMQQLLNNTYLKSKIVTDLQDLIFIYETLEKPKLMKLLFRASEHGFSGPQFHKHCDNIPHTFVLIKTQFGKVIGGYTPCNWEQSQPINDPSKKSFLISLNLHEKMDLINSNQAINRMGGYGPVFGNHDICIRNQCNTNGSYVNFPKSYNKDNKYKQDQSTYTPFCGASQGNSFNVIEYEVYEVQW